MLEHGWPCVSSDTTSSWLRQLKRTQLLLTSIDTKAESICAYMYIIIKLQNPTGPLKDCLFPFSSTVSSYNFRKPRRLILPTTRTSRYLNSFFYHSALLWNSLPSSIQSITKPIHFRQALTSHWREQKYQPVSQLFWLTNPLPHHFLSFKCWSMLCAVICLSGDPRDQGTSLLRNPLNINNK